MKIFNRNHQLFHILLQSGLLFIVIVTTFPFGKCSNDLNLRDYSRLPNYVIPHNYFIKLRPYTSSYDGLVSIYGESSIKIEIVESTSTITLHFVGFVSNVTLADENLILVPKIFYDKLFERIHLHFGSTIMSTGFYTLNVTYIAYPSNGIFTTAILNNEGKRVCTITKFKPIQARYIFPCWDEPKSKATFRIFVNNNHNEMILSNMPMKREINTSWTRTEISPKMSTYDVIVAIIPRNSVENVCATCTDMHFRCRQKSKSDLAFAYNIAKNITQSTISYMKHPMKVPILEQIVIPNMSEDTVINLGLVIYNEKDVTYDKNLDPIAQKVKVARLVAHAIAHQWFHSITPSWWNYQWMQEGLVIFFQTKNLLNILPDWRMRDLFVVQIQHESLHIDFDYNMKPLIIPIDMLHEIRSLFSYTLYVKAPAIFSMLERITSGEKFWKGVVKFIEKCNVDIVAPDDLWTTIQSISNYSLNETNVTSMEYELEKVMNAWTNQQNYPVVYVHRDYESNKTIFWQRRFGERSDDFNFQKVRWWVPISFTTQAEPAFSDTVPRIWLHASNTYVLSNTVDKDHWIIVNLQQSGYYRINYDTTNWKLIAKYLKTADYQKIHVLNRAQIIDDAYHLMMANLLKYDIFLDLIDYLSQETDYVAWYPMFKIFEYMSIYLPFTESYSLKENMLRIVSGVLMKIQYVDRAEDDDLIKCLRQEAARWACILNDPLCKQMANIQLQRHVEDPEEFKLLPNWKEWTFCNGLAAANIKTWNDVWNHLVHVKKTDETFNVLSCGEDPVILYTFANSRQIVKECKKCTSLIYHTIAKQAKDNLDFILANLKKYNIHAIKALSIIIDHLYSEHQIQKVEKFILENSEIVSTTVGILHKIRRRQYQILEYTEEISWRFKSKEKQTADKVQIWETLPNLIYRLPAKNIVKPLNYEITLVIPKDIEGPSFTINCEYKATIAVFRKTTQITLHSPDLNSSMHVHEASFSKHEEKISDDTTANVISKTREIYRGITVYDPRTQILTFNFEDPLSPGTYDINMRFDNTLRDNKGFFKTSYTNSQGKRVWMLATRFQPNGARQLFPCWDEPAIRTTFNIFVIHSQTYKVLSNVEGSFVRIDENNGLTAFNNRHQISIGSLVIVVLPIFDHVHHVSTDKGHVWCRPHLKPYVNYVSVIAESLENYLDLLLPKAPKLDHVAISDIQEEVIPHFGLIVYNEEAIIYDEEVDPIGRKIEACRLLTRAVAYHRFNTITPSWWSYLWLLDGLATYLGTDNKVLSLWRRMELFVVQIQHEALHLDTEYNMAPLTVEINSPHEIKSIYSSSLYLKAPAIMRMFQHIYTKDWHVFFRGLKRVVEKTHVQAITSNDLWRIMEKDRYTLNDNYRYKLSKVMNAWTTQMHYPVLNVIRDYSTYTVTVSQKGFDITNENRWWIPITYTTQKTTNFGTTFPKIWLNPYVQNLTLDEIYENNVWIMVNIQQIGYYRVNYDPTNWQLIANYLNSKKYSTIHVLNRAQIIDDAYHLMITDQLDYRIFLNLTNYLSRDTNYVAWYPMFKIFEYLSVFLPFQESIPLKTHMVNILRELLEKIKYEEHQDNDDDLTKCLRQEAAKWACIMGDTRCKRTANTKLRNYLKDPKKHKLLPGWKEWTYCHGLALATEVTRITIWNFAELYNEKRLLFMPCFGGIIPNFMLNMTPPKVEQTSRTSLLYIIIRSIPENHSSNLNYTLALLEEYTFFYVNDPYNVAKILTIIINRVYVGSHLIQIEKFAQENIKEAVKLLHIKYIITMRWHKIKHRTVKITNLINNRKFS